MTFRIINTTRLQACHPLGSFTQPNNSRTIANMKAYTSSHHRLVIINKGEEVHEQLCKFASEQALTSAWVSMIGGASSVTLGFYDIVNKTYIWNDYDEPLEIVSLSGDLAIVDGQPFFHLHGVFARRDSTCIAGHVKQCVIGLTGEALVTPLQIKIGRAFDEATGLKLICPAK